MVLAVVESHQAEVTVFLREGHALPDGPRQQIQQERDQVDAMVDRMIHDGIAAGELRADLDVAADPARHPRHVQLDLPVVPADRDRTSAEIADYFADLLLTGLSTEDVASTMRRRPRCRPAVAPAPAVPAERAAESSAGQHGWCGLAIVTAVLRGPRAAR